jgi:hypothetical protein
MENLRAQMEADLAETLEGEFSSPVELTGPDGETENVRGTVRYYSTREQPESGETVIVNEPHVALRVSSLRRVPKDGETWFIKIPISPAPDAPLIPFVFSGTRASENGTDIGFIRLYLQRIKSGVVPVS